MDSRREKLELWRTKTGRTPMKRMSYVQPCYIPPAPPSEAKPALSKAAHSRLSRTEVKKRRKVVPLAPLAQNVMSRGQNSAKPPSRTPADREALRRAFQRDIDDTVTEILAEEAENALARELDFDDSFTSAPAKKSSPSVQDTPRSDANHHKRRSCIYSMDQSLAFESSKICYSLVSSESRGRKRRNEAMESGGEQFLYLTPVRRTSRRSRSVCPHLEVKSNPCFTSPSELEGRGRVEVLPNEALKVLQADCSLVGANRLQGGGYLES